MQATDAWVSGSCPVFDSTVPSETELTNQFIHMFEIGCLHYRSFSLLFRLLVNLSLLKLWMREVRRLDRSVITSRHSGLGSLFIVELLRVRGGSDSVPDHFVF